jgi:hypothetical protein
MCKHLHSTNFRKLKIVNDSNLLVCDCGHANAICTHPFLCIRLLTSSPHIDATGSSMPFAIIASSERVGVLAGSQTFFSRSCYLAGAVQPATLPF